ncbi:Halomucin [Frankliniella fusca]|uniref:Halomucin n=1 Tax=Frankliniella fusca TaxID=407009 RepID=A0AAE1GWB2_9NEOP|nr:Halomucin [Frankliniella fusca]
MDDQCDFSCSFMYYPHEDDDETTYIPRIVKYPKHDYDHSINLANGVTLNVTEQQLHNILSQCPRNVDDNDKPTTSTHKTSLPLTFDVIVLEGLKLTLDSEAFNRCLEKSGFSSVTDDDKKSVTIDSDSDNNQSSSDSDKKPEESKKSKQSKKNKIDEKNKKKDKDEDRKRKSEKDFSSDVSSTESQESVKKSKPKRKRRSKPEKKDPADEDDSSDDEEIKKINQAASKILTYKSVKNLQKNTYYKVIDLSEVETSKGRTIRLKLEDDDVEDKWCYVHMPRNVLTEMIPLIQKLKEIQTLLEKKRKAVERQRKHRQNLNTSSRNKVREKARKKMMKFRGNTSVVEREQETKLNSERRFTSRTIKKTGTSFDSEVIDVHQHNFNCYENSLRWVECPTCHKRSMQSSFTKFKCGKNCFLFTKDNDMDPLDVPDELKSLTYIEKQLISRIHPVTSLYRVKRLQYKYKGHVINFPQDVQHVADTLPYLVEDLSHVVVVRLNDKVLLKDFVVRKQKVLDALLWLKNHNPHYSDICVDQVSLDKLPIDGNVYDHLRTISSESVTKSDNDNIQQENDEMTNNDDIDDLVHTNVPDTNDVSLKKSLGLGQLAPTNSSPLPVVPCPSRSHPLGHAVMVYRTGCSRAPANPRVGNTFVTSVG